MRLYTELGGNRLGTFLVAFNILAGVLCLTVAPYIAGIVFGRYIYGTRRSRGIGLRVQTDAVGIAHSHPIVVLLYLISLDFIVGHAEIVAVESLLEQSYRTALVGTALQAVDLIAQQCLILIEGVVLGLGQVKERLMDIDEHGAFLKAMTFLNFAAHVIKHLHHTSLIVG